MGFGEVKLGLLVREGGRVSRRLMRVSRYFGVVGGEGMGGSTFPSGRTILLKLIVGKS